MAEDVRTSISSSYNLCLQSFDKLNRLLVEPECEFRDELAPEDLKDQEGRFRVWAGNSGAHRTGRVSLDYKLREASHVHAKVIDLLGDLNRSLQEAISIINHDNHSDTGSSAGSSSWDGSSSSDDGSSIMSGPSLPAENLPTTTELEYTLLDVKHVITCLYKFSIALRQPTPRDRLHKYAAISVSHFEFFDIGHAREKFPGAAAYLIERLGKANMRRRQLLKYHRRHHDKIARYVDLPLAPDSPNPEIEVPTEEVETPQRRPTWGKVMAPEDFALQQPGPGTIATTMNTQTTVTTINPKFNPKNLDDIDAESETGQSQTSFASSSAGDAAKIKVPPPPGVDSLDGTPFECPYCFSMVIMRNSRSWMRHVMKDLKAYVCTFEHCAKPDQLFEYRHDWHDHEMQAHRREWVCEDCRKTFYTRSEIITHLRTIHGSLFTKKQLPIIADRCERANTSDQPCPLCDVPALPPARLRSHIARHLQQLALFVLPRGGEVVDDNVQSVGAQVSDNSEDDQSSEDRNSKEDLEFDSNPSRENSETEDSEPQKHHELEEDEPETLAPTAPVTHDRVLYPEKYLHPHLETFFGDLPAPKNPELAVVHAEVAVLIKHDQLEQIANIYEKIPWPLKIDSKREYISYFRAMAELLWKRERKDDAIHLLSMLSEHNGSNEKLLATELIAAGERCAVMLEQIGDPNKADQRYRWIWDTLSALDAPWEKWIDIAEKLTAKNSPAVYEPDTNPRRALLLERNKLVYQRLLAEASNRFTLRHPQRLMVMEKLAQQYELCGEWAAAAKLSWRCLELRRDLLVTEVYKTTKADVAQTITNLARQLRCKMDTYPDEPGKITLPIYDSLDIMNNFISTEELYCCLCQQHFPTTKELLKHEDVFRLHEERMKRPEAVEQAKILVKNGKYHNANTTIHIDLDLIRSLELEAYQLFEADLGEGHPSTVNAMERRALSLRQKLNNEAYSLEAIDLLEKVLFKRQHIFRSDNPSTLATFRNLTNTLEDLPLKAGPTRAAMMEDLYHKVLREHDTRFKTTHHHRVIREALSEPATHFADDFRAVWTHERIKERYFRDVLPQQVRALGWQHADTLRNLEGLATALEIGADHATEIIESELTYRHVLAVRRQNLGWNHSDTLWSLACVIRMLVYKHVRLESFSTDTRVISTLYQELLNCCYITLGKTHFQTRRIQAEALVWLVEREEWQEATTIQINIIESEHEQTQTYEMEEIQKLYKYMDHLVTTSTDLPVSLIPGTKTIYIAYATDRGRGPHHPDALMAQILRGRYFARLEDHDSALDTFKMAYDGAIDAVTIKRHSHRHRELRDIAHKIVMNIYFLWPNIADEKRTAAFSHIIEAYPKMAAAFTPPTDVIDMAIEVGKLLLREGVPTTAKVFLWAESKPAEYTFGWFNFCFQYFKNFFRQEPTNKSANGKKPKVNRNLTFELLASPTLSMEHSKDEQHPMVAKFVNRILSELRHDSDQHKLVPLHYWWAVQSSLGYDHPSAWEAFEKLEKSIWNENLINRNQAQTLHKWVRMIEPENPDPETYEALNDLFTRTANILSRHAYNIYSVDLWGRAFSFAHIIGPETEWARMAAYRGRMADIAAETFGWYVGSTPESRSSTTPFTAEQVIKWYEEKIGILEEYGYPNRELVETVKRERIRTMANQIMFHCKQREDPDKCVSRFDTAFDTQRIASPIDKFSIEVQDEKISDLLAHGLPQYALAWCEWAAQFLEPANNSVAYGYRERAGDIYLKMGDIIKAFSSYRDTYLRLAEVHDDEATNVALVQVKLTHKMADVLQIPHSTSTNWNEFGANETIPELWYRTALDICEKTPYIGLTHPTAIEVLFGFQGFCRQIDKPSRAYEPIRKALNKALEDKSNTKSTALLQATLTREKAKIQVSCKYFKKAEKCYQQAIEILENCPRVGSANEVTVQILFEFAEFYESEENDLKNWEAAKGLRQRIDQVAGTVGLDEETVRGNRERMKELVGLMISHNIRNRQMEWRRSSNLGIGGRGDQGGC